MKPCHHPHTMHTMQANNAIVIHPIPIHSHFYSLPNAIPILSFQPPFNFLFSNSAQIYSRRNHAYSNFQRGIRSNFFKNKDLICKSTASAQSFPFSLEAENTNLDEEIHPNKPLPPPPKTTTVYTVLPYLWNLAADDPLMNRRLIIAVVLLIIGKAAGLSGPLFFKKALDGLSRIQSMDVLPPNTVLYALSALVFSSASKAISSASMDARNVMFSPVGQATGRRIEYHLFNHILGLDLSFHLDRKTGSLARVIERGKRSIITIFRAVVFTFLPTAIELLVVCLILANHVNFAFSGIVFVTFGAYVAWTVALTKASVAIRKEVTALDNLTTAKVVDVLINYETVVQFDNQKLDLNVYDKLLMNYQKESIRLEKISAALNTGQMLILSIGLSCALAFAGWKVVLKEMTVGDLVLVNGLILQLSLPLQFLGFYYRDFRQSLVDIESMFSMFNTTSTIKDGHFCLPVSDDGAIVQLKNVKFSYKGSMNRMVVKGVSFDVKKGENVAIVGRSGSGKSTIVKLLLRLYDCDEGNICVDGLEINSLTMSSLRKAVAVVPQDTVLFNDTILYNIAYGKLSATFEEIKQAAIQAELHESILRMPDGYQTLVGERGLKLSGGEKQRVAIARAFLKSPRLLICDEATSALDSSTEVSILKSLKALSAGRTCVFVAHRLSTIKHCDKILVMDKGEIVEQGRHEVLLETNGRYAAMWQLQESQQVDFDEDEILVNYS